MLWLWELEKLSTKNKPPTTSAVTDETLRVFTYRLGRFHTFFFFSLFSRFSSFFRSFFSFISL